MIIKQVAFWAIICFICLNLLSSLLAYTDKRNAVHNKRRVPESKLMFAGFLGGAFGEYITMRFIHHKTKHAKFMIGLPLIMLFQASILIFIIVKAAN